MILTGFIEKQTKQYTDQYWELQNKRYKIQKLMPGKKTNVMCREAFEDIKKTFDTKVSFYFGSPERGTDGFDKVIQDMYNNGRAARIASGL